MSKLLNVYFNTSMSLGHKRLYAMAGKSASQGYSVFINRPWTALKMITPSNTILYFRTEDKKQPINFETIRHLPNCVNGGELNYQRALDIAVKDQYAKWLRKSDAS
jgi:hypothetical protein